MKSFIWTGITKGLEYTIAALTCWGALAAFFGLIIGLLWSLKKIFGGVARLVRRGKQAPEGQTGDAAEDLGPVPEPVAEEALA